jgi:hypothetical protein
MPITLPATMESIYANIVHYNRNYQSDMIDEARRAVVEDLGGSIPQVPLKDFIAHLAPPQPDFDLEVTVAALKADPEGILPYSNRWKSFDTEPKDQGDKEDTIYKPLTDIFNKIVDTIISNSKLTKDDSLIEFLQNPAMAPTSNERHNKTRPDGYFVLKDREKGDISWADVLLSCEYKRKNRLEDLDDVSVH